MHVAAVRDAMLTDVRPLLGALTGRIDVLSEQQRYEEAGVHRDRMAAFVWAASRMQRLAALTSCEQLVAARRSSDDPRSWELAVVRHGRLAAAGVMPPEAVPPVYVQALVATAETVRPGPGPTPAASAEETECVLRWLEQPGTRVVDVSGEWAWPRHGAASVRQWLDTAYAGRDTLAAVDPRRGLRPGPRPAR